MVRDIIIIGAAGTGREVAAAIEEINSLEQTWNIVGFVDDDPQKQGNEYNGYPILGPISTIPHYPSCQLIPILGSHRDLKLAKRIVDQLSVESDRFATIIHPSARVSRYAEIAPGTVVLQNCVITVNARIGKHVLVLPGSIISHDCVIDDYTIIAPNAVLLGGVCVQEGCYIGANSTILQNIQVGPWSCVGMGAAVFSDVLPNTTVVGNPARLLRSQVVE